MKTPLRLFTLACCVGMAFSPATAQERHRVPAPFDGTEAFGHILHSFDLTPVARIDDCAALPPEKTLLIVFGAPGEFDRVTGALGSLQAFREKGGAILLASDYRASIVLPPGQLSIAGSTVIATGASIYRGSWLLCPVVRNWTDSNHPLFRDLHKGLATNRPSYLSAETSGLGRLAEFSDDSVQESQSDDFQQIRTGLPRGAGYIFGSAKEASAAGRTVIIAGHGVFLNDMLIQADNDNFAFAWNTVDWLTQGPSGRRKHALFLHNGTVVDNFASPLSKIASMPIPPIQIINRVIRGLEDENVFNRFVLESFSKEHYLRGLLLLASLAVLIWEAWRIMHGRFHVDGGVPLMVSKLPTSASAVPVLEQRQEELSRLDNLWEPAQVLARQFFLDHAGMIVPLWDEAAAAPALVDARGSFWQRRRLARQVERIWKMARLSPGQAVSPAQLDGLLRLIADAAAVLAAGQARLAS